MKRSVSVACPSRCVPMNFEPRHGAPRGKSDPGGRTQKDTRPGVLRERGEGGGPGSLRPGAAQKLAGRSGDLKVGAQGPLKGPDEFPFCVHLKACPAAPRVGPG